MATNDNNTEKVSKIIVKKKTYSLSHALCVLKTSVIHSTQTRKKTKQELNLKKKVNKY